MEKIKCKASAGAIIWWIIGAFMVAYGTTGLIVGTIMTEINPTAEDRITFIGIMVLSLCSIMGLMFILIGFILRGNSRKEQLMKKQIQIQQKILENQEILKQKI